MSADIYWYENTNIIVQQYGSGATQLEDVSSAVQKTVQLADEQKEFAIVHVVMDVRKRGNEIDLRMLDLRHLRSLLSGVIGRSAWVVVVDPQPHQLMTMLASGVLKRVGLHLHVVKEFDVAIAFLKEKNSLLEIAE